jgi:salicylate hydroxylase
MFHRVNMHEMLMDSATGEGEGIPAVLKLDHRCMEIDHESGVIKFENGVVAKHDLIVGADGIGVLLPTPSLFILTNSPPTQSRVRQTLSIIPDKKQSTSTCYHCIIPTSLVKQLGLRDLSPNSSIEFWGGKSIYKIVFSPCREGEIHSFYCFFPTELSDHGGEGWNYEASVEQLLAPFQNLDKELLALFKNSSDIKPWRLFVHQPYDRWHVGRSCVLGDAAHPMMPDQSQGACQAIEDAAALGIIFSKKYHFTKDVNKGLQLYEQVRKPRATRVQEASARARENITERIGFSSNVTNPLYKVVDEKKKLTIEEMNE